MTNAYKAQAGPNMLESALAGRWETLSRGRHE